MSSNDETRIATQICHLILSRYAGHDPDGDLVRLATDYMKLRVGAIEREQQSTRTEAQRRALDELAALDAAEIAALPEAALTMMEAELPDAQ